MTGSLPLRPRLLVVCVGTATDIGKTWFGAQTLRAIRDTGRTAAARKPVQSFDPLDPHPTDAQVLAEATGEAATVVCPANRSLGVAVAPPMATVLLGLAPLAVTELVEEIIWSWPADVDVGWVETVGGVRAPIAEDADSRDLVRLLDPALVVLVADSDLGTLNAVRLSVESIGDMATPVVVALNRFDATNDLHCRNRAWLVDRDGLEVVTTPTGLAARIIENGESPAPASHRQRHVTRNGEPPYKSA